MCSLSLTLRQTFKLCRVRTFGNHKRIRENEEALLDIGYDIHCIDLSFIRDLGLGGPFYGGSQEGVSLQHQIRSSTCLRHYRHLQSRILVSFFLQSSFDFFVP